MREGQFAVAATAVALVTRSSTATLRLIISESLDQIFQSYLMFRCTLGGIKDPFVFLNVDEDDEIDVFSLYHKPLLRITNKIDVGF